MLVLSGRKLFWLFVGGMGFVLSLSLANVLEMNHSFGWLPYLAGGILGGLLVAALFEWSLIILSSLVGAVLIDNKNLWKREAIN